MQPEVDNVRSIKRMTVVYAREAVPAAWEKSIFLAGPSPSENGVISWRVRAVEILEKMGYDGVVFIPESRPDERGNTRFEVDYIEQVEWEEQCLNMADVIVFWVPRNRKSLPGITTNAEWGAWQDSGKVVFGAPEDAWKTRYLKRYAEKLKAPTAATLEDTISQALDLLGEGALRSRGERSIPLFIWRLGHFQQWYRSLVQAGNVLESARVVSTFRPAGNRTFAFLWIIQPVVYITKEGRSKTNEFVLSRTDISSVVLYRPAKDLLDTEIILVREFRSPVSNPTGNVWELPGGSSFKPNQNPLEVAADEISEETGLMVESTRLTYHGARQVVATFSTHKADLFSAPITDEEIAWLRSQKGVVRGVEVDSERTYVEVMTWREILAGNLVDHAMIGMIAQVLMRYVS
ncbi:MAG: nucleoside 2-deoxyribosyltransferase domain-containing protein [Candidatus Saccharibacteria bacterium]